MNNMDHRKDYLIAHGWESKGNCNCGGIYTLKFQFKTDSGEYKIKLRYSNFLLITPTQRTYKRYEYKDFKRIIDEHYENNKKHISPEA